MATKAHRRQLSPAADSARPAIAALLIAHGSRRAEANEDLARLAELVRARGEFAVVEIAYLELASPTIAEGARACVAQGVGEVRMLPFFLSAGRHVTEDLERIRSKLAAEFPECRFELCPPLGLHPLVVDVVMERLAEGTPRATSSMLSVAEETD